MGGPNIGKGGELVSSEMKTEDMEEEICDAGGGETAQQGLHLFHAAHHFRRKDATFFAPSIPKSSLDRFRLPLGSRASMAALSVSSRASISTDQR